MQAVLTTRSVDPALPDLLTRRGPLDHPQSGVPSRDLSTPGTSAIVSVNAVEERVHSHVLLSVSLSAVHSLSGTVLADGWSAILWDISEGTSY